MRYRITPHATALTDFHTAAVALTSGARLPYGPRMPRAGARRVDVWSRMTLGFLALALIVLPARVDAQRAQESWLIIPPALLLGADQLIE